MRVIGKCRVVKAFRQRLMLLDTASLYFRAFFGVPDTMKAADGTPTNAIGGLLDFIARLVENHRPTRLVACWGRDLANVLTGPADPVVRQHPRW